jgi:hypothetical protein
VCATRDAAARGDTPAASLSRSCTRGSRSTSTHPRAAGLHSRRTSSCPPCPAPPLPGTLAPFEPESPGSRGTEGFADLRFLLQDIIALGFASSWSVDVSMPRLGSVSALALAALLLIATGSAHACPAGVRHCPGSCPPVRPPGRRRCQAASRVPDGASSACDVGCDGRGPRHPLRRNPSPTARRHAPSCPSARHRPRAC